jgi:hypothetical protein
MANKGKISMMSLFEVVDRSKLKFLTDIDAIKDILTDKQNSNIYKEHKDVLRKEVSKNEIDRKISHE